MRSQSKELSFVEFGLQAVSQLAHEGVPTACIESNPDSLAWVK